MKHLEHCDFGYEYAGETMIVAAGITADGTKRVLGLRQGATENAAVCVALLEDLQARGLDAGVTGRCGGGGAWRASCSPRVSSAGSRDTGP